MSENKQGGASESAQNNTFAKLIKTKDFEEFLIFAKATATIPADINLDEISEDEQKVITTAFKQWKKAGKPSAVNPLEDVEPERLLRVSRVKVFGKQFLVCVISGQAIPEGIEKIPTYRKYKHNGKTVEDRTMVVSTKDRYTILFTKEKAKELITRCIEDSEEPQFTFKQGGHKITIRNPDNFIRDFDQVIKDARAGIPV